MEAFQVILFVFDNTCVESNGFHWIEGIESIKSALFESPEFGRARKKTYSIAKL